MFRSSLAFTVALTFLLTGCETADEASIRLGDALSFREDYARAAKAYESALLDLQEAGPEAARRRAETLMKLGAIRQNYLQDLDGALRAFRSASGSSVEELAREGRLMAARLFRHRMSDPKSASREFALLLQNSIVSAVPAALYLEAASTAFTAGEYDRARELASKVMQSGDSPSILPARELYTSVVLLEGQSDEALAALETLRTATLDPERRPELDFEIARVLEKLGRLDDAKLRYEEAKAGAPSAEWLEARLRKLDEALAARERESGSSARGATSGSSIRH